MSDDRDDDCWEDYYDPERDCPTCRGSGKVTTDDYESYLGSMYKPCPTCGGDPCVGEPPLS
jgi:DnaJ-class molecular chaperone